MISMLVGNNCVAKRLLMMLLLTEIDVVTLGDLHTLITYQCDVFDFGGPVCAW